MQRLAKHCLKQRQPPEIVTETATATVIVTATASGIHHAASTLPART